MNTLTKVLHETLKRFTFKDNVVILAKSNIDPEDKYIIHAQISDITREQAERIMNNLTNSVREACLSAVN